MFQCNFLSFFGKEKKIELKKYITQNKKRAIWAMPSALCVKPHRIHWCNSYKYEISQKIKSNWSI